jgi:hypothetical protein
MKVRFTSCILSFIFCGAALGLSLQRCEAKDKAAEEAEATVRTFVATLNKPDLVQALSMVTGAKPDPIIAQMEQDMKTQGKVTFTIAQLSTESQNDKATVAVKGTVVAATPDNHTETEEYEDTLQLGHDDQGWKFIPDSPEALRPGEGKPARVLSTMIYTLAHPAEVHESAESAACLNNLQQIATAVEQLLQEFGNRYAFTSAFIKYRLKAPARGGGENAANPSRLAVLVQHYIKDTNVMHCPEDDSGAESYTFNPTLENLSSDDIDSPGNTIMIYEGRNGELNFRHKGRAAVVLASGAGIFVNADQAKALHWLP